MFPARLVIQQQLQSQHLTHSTKLKNTNSFTVKVEPRQDVTKISDSCPSNSDDEMLPSGFEI